jgi:glycosyltransferase involved in cell wall biosynthesis
MKRILFITKGSHASSSRYRALDYFELFKAINWEAVHLADDRTISGRLSIFRESLKADYVVIVRRTISWWLLKIIRLFSKQLIFDFDDAIYSKSDGSYSPTRSKRFSAIIKNVDQVWAGNSHLAKKAEEHCDKVTVLPTSIEESKYEVSPPKAASHIDLVWIGSSSTKKHIAPMLPTFELLVEKIPNLRVKIIADFSLYSDVIPIINIKWSAENEANELASAHIGVAPLPDNDFTRGKCGLKVLQYMASELPVVSSPVGVNKDMVSHGRSGFLVESQEDWAEAIGKLASDQALRISMGQAGNKLFQNHFTLKATFRKMLTTLE